MTPELIIYVSGPYSSAPKKNTLAAMRVGDALEDAGLIVEIPHMSHFRHALQPRDYRHWMRVDLAKLRRCDALLRIPGHSPGAEEEIALAKSIGIPVFTEVDDVIAWARRAA